MTHILFFYPSNKRSVALETLILEIHRRGIRIEILTTCERGAFHTYLESQGVPTHTHVVTKSSSVWYYLRQIEYLVRHCRKNSVTAVFSNLQHANFIAVLAQAFISARVVIFRHHFKFTLRGDGIPLTPNRMERHFDGVINRLARLIVVPSSGVFNGMRDVEGADMTRVRVLPYVYDFAQYGKPDADMVERIQADHPARLRLLMSSRLVPYKRHALVFPVIRGLIDEGLDVLLFVLDDGPERDALSAYVDEHGLTDRILLLGFRRDFLEYMAASDLLVHPSLTEASSNVVKEMALLGKTAIVCQGVGDFDEYLTDGVTAFVVPRSTDGSEMARILRSVYEDTAVLDRMGGALGEAVRTRFGVQSDAVDRYLELAGDGI